MGLEVAVGYAAAWVWRKARRVAGGLDSDVDLALDAALERVHALVAAKLAGDPGFKQLEEQAGREAQAPTVAERTRQRVGLALEDAAEADEQFAQQLTVLIEAVRQTEYATGGTVPPIAVTASGERSVAIGRDNSGTITTGDGVPEARRS